MQKFKVKVVRVEYAVKEIEVEATSQEEANILAEEKAYDEHYDSSSVYDVEYSISDF